MIPPKTTNTPRRLTALALLLMLASGCAHTACHQRVAGFPGRKACALCADDVVRIMRRAGFTDPEILDYGPHMRNRIAAVGGARIRVGDAMEAIFSVTGQDVQVSSSRTGAFVFTPEESEQTMLSSVEDHDDVDISP